MSDGSEATRRYPGDERPASPEGTSVAELARPTSVTPGTIGVPSSQDNRMWSPGKLPYRINITQEQVPALGVRESLPGVDSKLKSNFPYDLTVWRHITNLFPVPSKRVPSWPGTPVMAHDLGEPRGVGPSSPGSPQVHRVTTRDSLSCTDLKRMVGTPVPQSSYSSASSAGLPPIRATALDRNSFEIGGRRGGGGGR